MVRVAVSITGFLGVEFAVIFQKLSISGGVKCRPLMLLLAGLQRKEDVDH
jgi:hypothetical protein